MEGVTYMSPEDERQILIKLEANDGTVVEVDQGVAFQCLQLKQMIQDLGIHDPDDAGLREAIKITHASGKILQKIMQWCTEHRGETFVAKQRGEDCRANLTEKDEEFLMIPNEDLVEIFIASDFLDIPGLVDIIAQKIANMAKGKTIEEIRHIYQLTDELHPDDREEVKSDVSWINQ